MHAHATAQTVLDVPPPCTIEDGTTGCLLPIMVEWATGLLYTPAQHRDFERITSSQSILRLHAATGLLLVPGPPSEWNLYDLFCRYARFFTKDPMVHVWWFGSSELFAREAVVQAGQWVTVGIAGVQRRDDQRGSLHNARSLLAQPSSIAAVVYVEIMLRVCCGRGFVQDSVISSSVRNTGEPVTLRVSDGLLEIR